MFNDRFARIVFWALAVIVPGGLVLLGLWAAARAAKARFARAPHGAVPPAPSERLPSVPAALPAERAAA